MNTAIPTLVKSGAIESAHSGAKRLRHQIMAPSLLNRDRDGDIVPSGDLSERSSVRRCRAEWIGAPGEI